MHNSEYRVGVAEAAPGHTASTPATSTVIHATLISGATLHGALRPARHLPFGVRMRLGVARCSVTYSGRLDAHLPEAVRPLMFMEYRSGDGGGSVRRVAFGKRGSR